MGDDESLSTNELIAVICSALGKRAHIWHLPKGIDEWHGKSGRRFTPAAELGRLTKLTENYVVSNAKIKRALGVDRMPIRAEEGLTQTVKSFANTK